MSRTRITSTAGALAAGRVLGTREADLARHGALRRYGGGMPTTAALALATIAAAWVALLWILHRTRRPPRAAQAGREAEPAAPVPLPDERLGSPEERGTGGAVQLDLTRAQQEGVQPIVEFLTYLQAKRGDEGHLLFVRSADLDAIASREGSDVEEFLGRLDQLGVVVSQN